MNAQSNLDPPTTTLTPEQNEQIRSRVLLLVVLVTALLVVSGLALPWRLAGLALSIGAVVVSVLLLRRLRRLRRAGARPPGRVAAVLGLVLSLGMGLLLVGDAAYYRVVSQLETCRAQAITQQAIADCNEEANRQVQAWLDQLEARTQAR